MTDKIELIKQEMQSIAPLTFLMAPTVAETFVQLVRDTMVHSGGGSVYKTTIFHDLLQFENGLRNQPKLSRADERKVKAKQKAG